MSVPWHIVTCNISHEHTPLFPCHAASRPMGLRMMDWLLLPIDPGRAHDVGAAVAWHGRLMVLAWGVLIPIGIVTARFFKVMPWQDWPRQLDSRLWWRTHLACQYAAGAAMLLGFTLIWRNGGGGAPAVHRLLGYAVLALGAAQFLAGWLRGSKGGPGEPTLRGDHYDMTARRKLFEALHKSLGYVALALGAAAILTGLHAANAPVWMWLTVLAWWAAVAALFIGLQSRGARVSTYEAIWGPDPTHPGNASGGSGRT
jgi:hypothetical protein